MRILGNRVLLKPFKEETTKSGIILQPDKKRKSEGEVISVGDNVDLKVGSRVVYSEFGGKETKIDGIEYEIVNYEDILAVYEE